MHLNNKNGGMGKQGAAGSSCFIGSVCAPTCDDHSFFSVTAMTVSSLGFDFLWAPASSQERDALNRFPPHTLYQSEKYSVMCWADCVIVFVYVRRSSIQFLKTGHIQVVSAVYKTSV